MRGFAYEDRDDLRQVQALAGLQRFLSKQYLRWIEKDYWKGRAKYKELIRRNAEMCTKTSYTEDFLSRLAVRESVYSLPPRCREVIYRMYWLGQTQREIAKELGITFHAVRDASYRGICKLRKFWL